jgi:hypothetical protein
VIELAEQVEISGSVCDHNRTMNRPTDNVKLRKDLSQAHEQLLASADAVRTLHLPHSHQAQLLDPDLYL